MKKYRLVCSVCGKPFERDTEPYVSWSRSSIWPPMPATIERSSGAAVFPACGITAICYL